MVQVATLVFIIGYLAFVEPVIMAVGLVLLVPQVLIAVRVQHAINPVVATEVLRIVYLTDKAGADSGGFYPKGMNGMLKSTCPPDRLPQRQVVEPAGSGGGATGMIGPHMAGEIERCSGLASQLCAFGA